MTGQEILDRVAAAQEAICLVSARASSEFLAGKVSEVIEIEVV